MLNPRHLHKLPPKSFSVAPGDVIGGLIYVMDKPLGIEEGMVGISVDSEPYRKFIKDYIAILEDLRAKRKNLADYDKKDHPHLEALSKRYNQLFEKNRDFDEKSENEKIDLLLQDKIHVKKRHGASWKEFKQVFSSFSKYHDMKGWQSYYVNKGMGGLLFQAYKDKCGIKKKDHFATQIGKLITDKDKVVDKAYMVKQDGQMALGGTGPGWRKMLKTNTGKTLQKLVNPWVILCTGGLSALAFGIGMLGWRAFYLNKNKPAVSNSEAIIEALSTKMASKRGLASQEIDTIEGTYENGIPKVATIVTWAPGCRDLSGKLTGSNDWSSVIVQWDKNDHPVKVDNKGNIIRTNGKDEKGNITSYEKILKDGTVHKATAQEYQNAKAVSDDRIAGLGESLISFISMGDRDGIGKAGQNKAIMPLNPPEGNRFYQFFGIDFGKAYKQANPIIHTLKDDFSFENPSSRQSRFVNYSIMYDNPLREKMKGVYLLAALRDKLTPEMKEKIAKEYESENDNAFADKLRRYPVDGIDSDINLIQDEITKYEQLANDVNKTDEQKEQYRSYANRLKEMKKIAIATDKVVLDTFSKRVNLTPKQIDLLDNIEKLTAKAAHSLSPDGTVLLNHLRVENKDRCAWQLKVNENGTCELQCEETQKLNDIKRRLQTLDNALVQEIFTKIKTEDEKLVIKDLTADELSILSKHLTEENVAKSRNIPYRTEQMRNQFHESLALANDKVKNIKEAKVEKALENQLDPPQIKHVGAQYRQVPPSISANTDTVLTQRKATLEDMVKYLEKDENKLRHEIVHMQNIQMGSFKQFQGLRITFKHPDKNIEARIFAEQTKDGLKFSFPKNLNQSDFDFSAKEMTKLAVSLAGIGEEFHLSYTSDAQKETLEKAIKDEIEMAIIEQRFDQITQPQVGSDKHSQRMSL